MFNLNRYTKQSQTYHHTLAHVFFFFLLPDPSQPVSGRHPGIEKLLLSFGAKPGSKLPEPLGMNTYGALADHWDESDSDMPINGNDKHAD